VDAAEAFQKESGADPGVDLSAIRHRMEIRRAVQSGNVEAAIERVNDLDSEILEERAELLFHLQQQQLIELIRSGQIDAALEFAQERLAPRGEDNPKFLEELERTVALLLFENPAASPMGDLLEPAQRQRTANELNAAILASQSNAERPKLPNMLKFLVWAQEQLSEKANFPQIDDLAAARPRDAAAQSTGDEEMMEATL
jgi:glucose-induced degradation protein 8